MAIGYTELDFVNGSAPALSAANLNHIDEALKDACDLLDAETVAGRALATAADVAAQHAALGLGDSATKNVGTGAGDVAAGNAPADAVTTHESTYAHANLPTADEKTRLGDIQAASGATTALKLANLTSPATPTQQGVALLGANGGAIKDTKMPDNTGELLSQIFVGNEDPAVTLGGWSLYNCTGKIINGVLRLTSTTTGNFGLRKALTMTDYIGKTATIRANKISGTAATLAIAATSGMGTVATYASGLNTYKSIFPLVASGSYVYLFLGLISAIGDTIDLYGFSIGDGIYLTGSLSEEAARIANQLGDTAGVGVAASGTITATDLATAGKGDTIHGKKYTFVDALTASPGVEGEVLKAATKEEEIENENLAISEVSRANNGVKYWAAAVHPLVSTTGSGAVLNISAKTPGLAGNQITVVCESGTNHTASGSTLSGGYSDAAAKIITATQNNIAGSGTRPAAARIDITNTALVGYEDEVDKAVGATLTFPAGGTWIWFVHGYGANVGGQKKGSSAGGATITMAGANGSIWYRKYS